MSFLEKLFRVLAGVFGGDAKPVTPTVPTKPIDVTPEELVPEAPVVPIDPPTDEVPIAELGDLRLVMWADWFRSDNGVMNEFTDGTDKATPARLARILRGDEDMPPGAIVRVIAEGCVQPQDIKPVPLNEFQYHVLVFDEKGKTVLDHQVVRQAEQKTGQYFKSVPNRWNVTNGWEVQLKFVPQVGSAQMPDKQVGIYMTYKDLKSNMVKVGWRHYTPPKHK